MRIAIGQIVHETSSFSSELTDEAAFKQLSWCEGEELIQTHQGVEDYIGGMLDEAKLIKEFKMIPTFGVSANPSGLIKAETWYSIKTLLLDRLLQAGPLDAICLDLHGAGISESANDIEGELLEAIRKEFGHDIPIVATLDLHANMTEKMVQNADILLGVNYYPHTDSYERGREVIQLLHKMIEGKINPIMSLVKLPMVIPTSTTMYGPVKEVNEMCWAAEQWEGILDCTFFHGFPYSDIPEVGVSVLAIADGSVETAFEAANEIATKVWKMRKQFQISLPSVQEGLEVALASSEFPVVINETSDNPGAGTPGDGTYLLAEMLKTNADKTCFAHICDPEVVETAYQAGVGEVIRVNLGGKKDGLHGEPLPVSAKVLLLTDCVFTLSSPMWKGRVMNLGRSTRLLIGQVDVIVTSIKAQLMDDELLKLHGIDMYQYKVIGLKSSQHFRAFFQAAVPKIITVDSPGISTFDFSTFKYKSFAKEKYPLNLLFS